METELETTLPDELRVIRWLCPDCGAHLSLRWLRGANLRAVGHCTCSCGARFSGRFGASEIRRLAKRSAGKVG